MSVIIGVDPHKATHTAVAIDRSESEVARARVRATRKQVPQPGFLPSVARHEIGATDSVPGVSEPGGAALKFMLIFRGGAVSRSDLSPRELQAHVAKWYTWSDELTRQGRHIAGTPLDNPGVTVRGHERMVTDGPYAESKDLVTGSMIIDAASLEDAIEVARTCPTYEFDGSVEVRPVQDDRT